MYFMGDPKKADSFESVNKKIKKCKAKNNPQT